MNTKKKILISVAVGLTLVGAVGLSCLSHPSLKTLAPPTPCSSWGRLPLKVYVVDNDDRLDVLKATEDWNSVSPRPLFEITQDESSADVVVSNGENRSKNDAETFSVCSNGRVRSTVSLNSVPENDLRLQAFEHELGHAAGLGHFEGDTSVMSPAFSTSFMSDVDLSVWENEWKIELPRKPSDFEAKTIISLHR